MWTGRETTEQGRIGGRRTRRRYLAVTAALLLLGPLAPDVRPASEAFAPRQDDELEELLAAERAEADALRRRGAWESAGEAYDTLVREAEEEGEDDWRSRAGRARLDLDRGRFDEALAEAAHVALARPDGPPEDDLATAHAVRLAVIAELGRSADLDDALAAAERAGFAPGVDARVDRAAGEALLGAGRREAGLARLRAGARVESDDWKSLLARARCARRLGDIVGAAQLLVRAVTRGGREAEVLAELADVYLEADGEIDDQRSNERNPGPLLREALRTNPRCETALLVQYRLHRLNWRRSAYDANAILASLLDARPASVEGLLEAASAELDLGDLAGARRTLAALERLAPGRREVRAFAASVAAVDGGPAAARAELDPLLELDPLDSVPERIVGTHLVELYRFAEGVEVLRLAVERDGGDYTALTQLGRALANTGDVHGAREALDRAKEAAAGRRDVVRANLTRVLRIVDTEFVERKAGELTFAWHERGSDLLALYLVPFYSEARVELSARYAYPTGPIRIEVFDRHADFSVRSTGFEGFPALGVCFGPVVTAVSPLAELRGTFSWARTGYHEFTHVMHLGLSHNRCPRWVTEGLATWEEQQKRSSWTRNMRRELLDARANGLIFPVRDLNAAFRGPRVVFGYYQGGLLCDMLIREHGFPSMLRLLEQFDSGADLDTALRNVFDATPEELDERFARYVDELLEGIALEPSWDADVLRSKWLTLPRRAPEEAEARRRFARDWTTLAMSALQDGNLSDAQEALRIVATAGDAVPPRADFVRAQIAFERGDTQEDAGSSRPSSTGAATTSARGSPSPSSHATTATPRRPRPSSARRSTRSPAIPIPRSRRSSRSRSCSTSAVGRTRRWRRASAGSAPTSTTGWCAWNSRAGTPARAATTVRRTSTRRPTRSSRSNAGCISSGGANSSRANATRRRCASSRPSTSCRRSSTRARRSRPATANSPRSPAVGRRRCSRSDGGTKRVRSGSARANSRRVPRPSRRSRRRSRSERTRPVRGARRRRRVRQVDPGHAARRSARGARRTRSPARARAGDDGAGRGAPDRVAAGARGARRRHRGAAVRRGAAPLARDRRGARAERGPRRRVRALPRLDVRVPGMRRRVRRGARPRPARVLRRRARARPRDRARRRRRRGVAQTRRSDRSHRGQGRRLPGARRGGYRLYAELRSHARLVDGRGTLEVHARVLAEVERARR
ncbi:MAG: hypothetical protein R3F34_02745 [Planctomycetota bacterium]